MFLRTAKNNKSVMIHKRNLQILVTEIFKTTYRFNPEIMKNIFSFIKPIYHLRNNNQLKRHVKSEN